MKHIYLVEDDPKIADMLKDYLWKFDYKGLCDVFTGNMR